MGWSKSSLNLKGPKGDDGATGATGAAGTTTWAGITDKPATIAAGTTKADARSAIDAEYTGNKGQANGYASLDSGGKVPVTQLPNSIMEYQGTWNVSTNTPTLADGTGNSGDVYRVSVAGIRNLGSGAISFAVGDYAIYNGATWEKADTTDAVSSVNTLTGDVTLTASSVGAEPAIASGTTSQYLRGDKSWQTLDKAAVGLGSVDNTADSAKAVLSASKFTTARNIDGQSFNGSADITVIAPGTYAATAKTTPVDADVVPLVDSEASNVLKKLSWSNIKAALKTYFDSVTTTLSNKSLNNPYMVADGSNIPQMVVSGPATNLPLRIIPKGNEGLYVANPAVAGRVVAIYPPTDSDGAARVQVNTTNVGLNLVSNGTGTVQANGADVVTISATQAVTNKDLTSGTNTFPTFNQSTTGSAAKWTTARNLANNSVDGSANVAFANKFVVQGTTDPGLSGAQFLGSLGTGIVKNTTTTGVLSIAVAADFPTLNQNTSGSAATLTTSRNIQTNLGSTTAAGFNGSADVSPGVTGTLPVGNGGTGATTLTGLVKGTGTTAMVAATAGTDYVAPGGALGTPASGTLTNCTGLPITGLTASTSSALGVGSIELGHASDTTLTRSAAGKLAVEGVDVVLSGGALGTPSGGTLTNCTGLPVAGIAASTSTALGVGSIELGHATDTTLSRSAAGKLAVEGVDLVDVSSTQSLSGKTLTNPTVTNYTESVVAIGTVSSANTIALTSGTVQTATLTASTACTFTMPTATAGKSFTLLLKQAAATGNGTATFTGVKWGSAGAPTITATAGKMDILSFVSDGTNWYGTATQGFTP